MEAKYLHGESALPPSCSDARVTNYFRPDKSFILCKISLEVIYWLKDAMLRTPLEIKKTSIAVY
jgi:hypothetical protein